jgi:hypothetical protein
VVNSNVLFEGNKANAGAAIASYDGYIEFIDSDITLRNNIADQNSGVIVVGDYSTLKFAANTKSVSLMFNNNVGSDILFSAAGKLILEAQGAYSIDISLINMAFNSQAHDGDGITKTGTGDVNFGIANIAGDINNFDIAAGKVNFYELNVSGFITKKGAGTLSVDNANIVGDISVQAGNFEANRQIDAANINLSYGAKLVLTDYSVINANVLGQGQILKTGYSTTAFLNKSVNILDEITVEEGQLNVGDYVHAGTITVNAGAIYSMQNNNATQTTQVDLAYINGSLSFDLDFSNGNSDKFNGTINFGNEAGLIINGYGDGYAGDIIIMQGTFSNASVLQLSGFIGVKYELVEANYKLYLSTKAGTAADDEQALKDNSNTQISGEITIDSNFEIATDKIINGGGLKGEGNAGIKLNGEDKTLELNDVSVKDFGGADQAIEIAQGKLIIAANNSDVKFENNKKDLHLSGAAAVVDMQASHNKKLTFNGEVSGARGSQINKNGNSDVVFGGNLNSSGSFVVNEGALKVTGDKVFISTLSINAGGKFSSADEKSHEITVEQAHIDGTVEIALSGNLITVTNTVFISTASIWQLQSFGENIVEGAQINILQVQNNNQIVGSLNYQGSFISNGKTIRYAVYDSRTGGSNIAFATAGGPADPNFLGIYARILDTFYYGGGVGMSARFFVNTIRTAAINNDAAIFSNSDKNIWVSGNFSGSNLKDADDVESFKSDGFGAKAGVKVLGDKYEALGIFAGFDNKNFKQGIDNGKSEEFDFGIYGMVANGQLTAKANVGWAFRKIP